MRTSHTPYTYARRRQVKKPRHRRLFIGVIGIIVLFFGYSLVTHKQEQATPQPSTKTSASQNAWAKDVQFAWPSTGYAAIGSVEDGLLARSSDNEQQLPTASMAKVIAALAIMEKQPIKPGQAGKSYTLTAKDVAHYHTEIARGGSTVPVYEGLVLTQYQAMQAMLIASSNNMAETLVERTFGSTKAYKSYAQNMLHRMGLDQTVVADASGFSPATVSTPSELVMIGIAALKNPVIAEIVGQSQAWIPGIGSIKNTNELLGAEGVIGIKTGTTTEAGSCLLFAARYSTDNGQKMTIVGVIMGDTNATNLFADSRKLLASIQQGFGVTEEQ